MKRLSYIEDARCLNVNTGPLLRVIPARMISDFRRGVNEVFALLGRYAAYIGS